MRLFTLLLLLCASLMVKAQRSKRTAVWYFGRNAGLDFNTSPPKVLKDGQLNTWEGCATICDEQGKILMYTDGSTVWNKYHNIIPNATDLGANNSTSQSSLIIPKPGSKDIYYVLSVDYESSGGGIQFSEIDVNDNSKQGKVISKNNLLLKQSSEKLTAIQHDNGKDYWILAHGINSNKFYSWLLDEKGINKSDPIVSSIGSDHGEAGIGCMKSSSDGKKIAVALYEIYTVELFDFDKTTGVLSNAITLTDTRLVRVYGIEFSPNSKLLYLAGLQTFSWVYQADISLRDSAAIIQSLVELPIDRTLTNDFGTIQLAYDGKIYIAQERTPYLAVINKPDQKGIGCYFVENAIELASHSSYGLPNFIPSLFNENSIVDNKSDLVKDSFVVAKPNNIPVKEEPVYLPPRQIEINGQTLKKGESIALNSIAFEQSKSDLTLGGKAELDKVAQLMKKYPTLIIELSGHTSNEDENEPKNLKLSEERVAVCKKYIFNQVADVNNRIKTVGYGSSKPRVSNNSDENRKKNRRVELRVDSL